MGNCNCIKFKATNGIDEINENLSPEQMMTIDYNTFKEEVVMQRNQIYEPIDEELIHLCYKSKKENTKSNQQEYIPDYTMQEIIF